MLDSKKESKISTQELYEKATIFSVKVGEFLGRRIDRLPTITVGKCSEKSAGEHRGYGPESKIKIDMDKIHEPHQLDQTVTHELTHEFQKCINPSVSEIEKRIMEILVSVKEIQKETKGIMELKKLGKIKNPDETNGYLKELMDRSDGLLDVTKKVEKIFDIGYYKLLQEGFASWVTSHILQRYAERTNCYKISASLMRTCDILRFTIKSDRCLAGRPDIFSGWEDRDVDVYCYALGYDVFDKIEKAYGKGVAIEFGLYACPTENQIMFAYERACETLGIRPIKINDYLQTSSRKNAFGASI